MDFNDEKPWSEADIFDLRRALKGGDTLEEAAAFLRRTGTVPDVARKADELRLMSRRR